MPRHHSDVSGDLDTIPPPPAITRTVCIRKRGIYCSSDENVYAVTAFPLASRRLSLAAVRYSPRSLTHEGIRTASLATTVELLQILERRVTLYQQRMISMSKYWTYATHASFQAKQRPLTIASTCRYGRTLPFWFHDYESTWLPPAERV